MQAAKYREMEICKQQCEGKWRYASNKARWKWADKMRHLPAVYRLSVTGVGVGVANLDQSIGIDETSKFQLKFCV